MVHKYIKEMFPNLSSCQSKRLCDPDQVLPMHDPNTEYLLQHLEREERRCYTYSRSQNGHPICVQIDVTILQQMDPAFLAIYKDRSHRVAAKEVSKFWLQSRNTVAGSEVDPSAAATLFCNSTMNHTKKCTTMTEPAVAAVVVFFSCHDRVWSIAWSDALAGILTDARTEILVRNLQWLLLKQQHRRRIPAFRQQQQQQPIHHARDCTAATVMEFLRGVEFLLEMGEPPIWEQVRELCCPYLVHGLFFIVAILVAYNMKHQKPSVAAKDATPRLSVEERIRAEQLQQKFQNQSCPICHESFRIHPDGIPKNSIIVSNSRIGSDGIPVQLLRCGHILDASCWSEWSRVGCMAASRQRCPVCRETVF